MTRLGRSYAQAFLDAAPKGYDVVRFLAAAGAIADALKNHRLRAFFLAPSIPPDTKEKTLEALAEKAGLDDYGLRLLRVVQSHGRLPHLPEIVAGVREELDRREGVVAGRVTVAAAIGEEHRGRIEESLSHRVGKRVRMVVNVDPAILGGFVAKIGSRVFDASVANAIDRFRHGAEQKVET